MAKEKGFELTKMREMYYSSISIYHSSSPISLVIFLVFDTEIWEISNEKREANSWGFGIKKQLLLNLVVLIFFFNFFCWKVSNFYGRYQFHKVVYENLHDSMKGKGKK